jgi:ligand-binding sensor domain-containing protein
MRLLLVIFFFIHIASSLCQEYAYRSFSVAEGLPQSQVTSINQDSQGFLWVGTLGGLARFSGNEFISYTVENGLLNNRISFVEVIDDTVWVGHENGVSKKIGKSFEAFQAKNIQEGVKFSSIRKFNNQLIVASNGGGLYTLKNSELTTIPVEVSGIDEEDVAEFDRIRDMLIVDDTLYVATRMGVYLSSDAIHFSLINGTEDFSVSSLKWNEKWGIVFSTFGDGIQLLKNNKVVEYKGGNLFSEGNIRHLCIDYSNNFWLSSKFEGAMRIGSKRKVHLSTKNGFPIDNISCVFEDNTHTIWLGTEGKGLVRFAGEAFVHYTSNSGLGSDLIVSIIQDDLNNFWFGSYTDGLSKLVNGKWTYLNTANGLSNNTVWCSLKDRYGTLWFGTNYGLNRYINGKTEQWDMGTHLGLPGNKISALFQDSKGVIWIGGKEGVSRYQNGQLNSLTRGQLNEKNYFNVRSFTESNGIVYFTSQTGLYAIDKKGVISPIEITPSNLLIYSLESDSEGGVWMGTEEGVFVYKNKHVFHLNYTESSSGNYINFIKRQGSVMWVGTNNGIFRFKDFTADYSVFSVQQFGIADGLISLETNLNSAFIDKENTLWFGTSEGLMHFDPEKENFYATTVAPVLTFNNLTLNYQLVSFSRSVKLDENGLPVDYKLAHNENRLVFSFTGVLMVNSQDLKYQFFLEGVNEEWSPLTRSSEVTYSNLSSGAYVLRARAVSKHGIVSNEIVFSFAINPPFYATWWFVSLLVLFVGSIVYGVFKFQLQQERNRRNSERLEFTSKLRGLEQQSLNASMNRHFIFNALNSIQYFINTQDKLSANKYLSQFAKLIRKNLDSSSNDNNNVTLNEEIERLKLYLSLESMRFVDRFEYSFDIDEDIDGETLLIPSMIFQPFIENSIIHGILPRTDGVKGKITFTANRYENVILFTLEDNGVGYEKSLRFKKENGDHQSKGMTITSSRIDLLHKISGKTFELNGPFDIKDTTGESIGTRVEIKIQDDSLVD